MVKKSERDPRIEALIDEMMAIPVVKYKEHKFNDEYHVKTRYLTRRANISKMLYADENFKLYRYPKED